LPPDTTTPTRALSTSIRFASSDRAARLGDDLQPVEEERHRVEDLGVRDRDDLIDESPVHLERQLAGLGRLQAVGDRARYFDAYAFLSRKRATCVVARLGFDADDADRRKQRLRDGRAACDQPAAADRHDEELESGHVLDELERGRPLTGHHERIVVRLHERAAALRRDARADLLAAVRPPVVADDLGAVAARRVELRRRRVLGPEDGRARAE
jgi:hypothetical protein